MFNRKKDKDLNDKTHTITQPLEMYESGPHFFKEDAFKSIPYGWHLLQFEQRPDGWYVMAVMGLSTSTVTTTYYPWPKSKPVSQ